MRAADFRLSADNMGRAKEVGVGFLFLPVAMSRLGCGVWVYKARGATN